MKFELGNFTPPSFTVVNSALLGNYCPQNFSGLLLGGTAWKCKQYKRFCANSFTTS